MPRLPAPTATFIPGRMNCDAGNCAKASCAAFAGSPRTGASKTCLSRKSRGRNSFMGSSCCACLRLETDSFEVAEALRNLSLPRRRFILDKVPLHACRFGGAEQWREVNLALADRHVIAHVRVTC